MIEFQDEKFKDRLLDVHNQEEEVLVKSLAQQYGMSYVNLRGYTINPDALRFIDRETASSAEIIAFDYTFDSLSVAIRTPNNPKTQDKIEALKNEKKNIKVYLCSKRSIQHGLKRYEDLQTNVKSKKGMLDINAEVVASHAKSIKSADDVSKAIQSVRSANNVKRVSETIELIFAGAVALGASDIHIEPEVNTVRIRYRMDGVLQNIADIENKTHNRIMSRIKLLSGMVLNQQQQAQDGRFTFTIEGKEIEIRSSIIPDTSGESIVMRLLDPSVAGFTLEKIGLNDQMYELLNEQLKRPNGLIITTGPTGSGKTTALYALLRKAHTQERKIITIENPVEYKIDGIVQTQVGGDYTFAGGLRAILRQDPDVIMVGEIRDEEVASTAIHAAQTGHLVFSTLHTNHAIGAFPRLIDIGIDSRMIGSSVNVVLAQRLVRVLCASCKRKRNADENEVELIKKILTTHPFPPELNETIEIHDSVGCSKCGQTGFAGRAAIFEAVVVDEAVEEMVINDPREHMIAEAAKPQKIPTMAEEGISKVLKGETSLPELRRVVDLSNGRHTYHSFINNTTEYTETESDNKKEDKKIDDDFLSHVV